MSLITVINGVPLYTTKKEASNWAISNKLRGYHTHIFKNKKGYMGGINHSEIKNKVKYGSTIESNFIPNVNENAQVNQNQQTPVVPLQTTRPQPVVRTTVEDEPIRRTTPVRTTTPVRRTSSGGGGGGGGY